MIFFFPKILGVSCAQLGGSSAEGHLYNCLQLGACLSLQNVDISVLFHVSFTLMSNSCLVFDLYFLCRVLRYTSSHYFLFDCPNGYNMCF